MREKFCVQLSTVCLGRIVFGAACVRAAYIVEDNVEFAVAMIGSPVTEMAEHAAAWGELLLYVCKLQAALMLRCER